LEKQAAPILRLEEEKERSLFYIEDGGSMFLQNISNYLPNYTVPHPKRQ
jgi:hypothetical protein